MPELREFVHDAVNSMGLDDEKRGDDPIDEDTPAALMWARLSPADQEAILGGDADLYDRRAREDIEARLREGGPAAEGDYYEDGGGDDEAADGPLSGRDLQEAVRGMVVAVLDDPDGAWAAAGAEAGMDPGDYAIWIATASPAEWAAYCRETGWRPEVRPSREDLPVELQVELTRRNMYANLERERKGYERGAGAG